MKKLRNPKDPDARLDYAFDWSAWLEDAETIESYTLAVASGDVALDGDAEAAGIITAWLIDGTDKTFAEVTCHIVTSLGREDDRTLGVNVAER